MEYLEKLKALKEEKGLTLVEIARLSNVPLTTVQRIFNGTTPNPTFETIAQIAIALGSSLDELTGLKQPIPEPIVTTLDSYAELLREKDVRINDLKAEVKEVRKEKHRFALALAIIVGFVLVVLTIDVMNGHFGYFRY